MTTKPKQTRLTLYQLANVDTHPNHSKHKKRDATDILALCGNIGQPMRYPGIQNVPFDRFLQFASQLATQVVFVPGPKEYEHAWRNHLTIHDTDAALERMCRLHKITFLSCSTAQVPNSNLTLIGCTLWNPTVQPPASAQWHRIQKKWVEQTLQQLHKTSRQAIVVTHHTPDQKWVETLNQAFESTLVLWVSGEHNSSSTHEIVLQLQDMPKDKTSLSAFCETGLSELCGEINAS